MKSLVLLSRQNSIFVSSIKSRGLVISFPRLHSVLLRRAVHVFAEGAVEIADIVVSAVKRYGAYGQGAVAQHIAGGADAVIVQIFHYRHIDLRFKKTAELSFTHVKLLGKSTESKIAVIIQTDILKYVLNNGDFGVAALVFGRNRGGGIPAQIMPYAKKLRFYEQLVSRGSLAVQTADFLKRGAQLFAVGIARAEMVAEKKSARRLTVDVFLLYIVVAVAAYQLTSEINGIEAERCAELGGQRMQVPGIDKKYVAQSEFKAAVVYMSDAVAVGDGQQLVLLMPVSAYTLGAGNIGGIFVQHQVKTHISVQ